MARITQRDPVPEKSVNYSQCGEIGLPADRVGDRQGPLFYSPPAGNVRDLLSSRKKKKKKEEKQKHVSLCHFLTGAGMRSESRYGPDRRAEGRGRVAAPRARPLSLCLTPAPWVFTPRGTRIRMRNIPAGGGRPARDEDVHTRRGRRSPHGTFCSRQAVDPGKEPRVLEPRRGPGGHLCHFYHVLTV